MAPSVAWMATGGAQCCGTLDGDRRCYAQRRMAIPTPNDEFDRRLVGIAFGCRSAPTPIDEFDRRLVMAPMTKSILSEFRPPRDNADGDFFPEDLHYGSEMIVQMAAFLKGSALRVRDDSADASVSQKICTTGTRRRNDRRGVGYCGAWMRRILRADAAGAVEHRGRRRGAEGPCSKNSLEQRRNVAT